MEIKITGLTVVATPKPNKGGDMIMAYFDFAADFVSIRGAALVRLASGSWTMWEPLAKDDAISHRSVKLKGYARREIAQAALPVFEMMGGEVEEVQHAAE